MTTESDVRKAQDAKAIDDELEAINRDAAIARARLADLEQRRRDVAFSKARLVDAQIYSLATQLHDTFCAWNHTDGCGWGYEESVDRDSSGTWACSAHAGWLNKAKTLVTQFGVNAVVDAVRIYAEIKKDAPEALAVIEAARRG